MIMVTASRESARVRTLVRAGYDSVKVGGAGVVVTAAGIATHEIFVIVGGLILALGGIAGGSVSLGLMKRRNAGEAV